MTRRSFRFTAVLPIALLAALLQPVYVSAQSRLASAEPGEGLSPTTLPVRWHQPADGRDVSLRTLAASSDSASLALQQTGQQERNWIGRHPVLFGALVGFGVGFAAGYPQGRASARGDPSSDYLTPEQSGLFWGGVGAGGGALVGLVIGRR
ncbi:MAG: hypothetical protein OEW19_11945 [Acidobacteriota bacterium]|nr:hypothetical protein [Acidobacteriota bacterium]